MKASKKLEIGSRIKEIRISRGFTIEQLAKKTKIGYATLSRIENGYRDIKPEELLKIAEITNKPISFFYEIRDEIEKYITYNTVLYFNPKNFKTNQ